MVEEHEKKMAITKCSFEVAFRTLQAPGLGIFLSYCCGWVRTCRWQV